MLLLIRSRDGIDQSKHRNLHKFSKDQPPRVDGTIRKQGPTELGYGVVDVFVGYPREYFTENIFRSVGVVPLVQLGGEKGDATWIQTSYLQAEQLRKPMHRAFAGYALALMYDNTTNYVNTNLTEALPGTVLSAGPVPPVVVLCLLAV